MDTVSNNLANVNTLGFKQDTVIFKEYYDKLVGQDLESEEVNQMFLKKILQVQG